MATEIESLEVQIESQATEAASGIDKLTASLSKLKSAVTGTTNSVNKSKSATDNVTASNKKAATSYVNLYAKIKLISGAFKGVVNFLSQCVYSSMEYTETVNMYAVSLGEYAEEAKKTAEELSAATGIDPAQFLEYEGIFNTIIEGFGVASDKAYLMSQNLTQIGYDLASMYNISFEAAMQKVQSGISGELEPLRRLGYDLSVARLEQERLNLGIEKSVADMTQAEKAQLRYYAIMTQVTVVQGDMARTLNSPANQLRVFKAQLQLCARAIGNIFIPALNAVLPFAIAVAKAIRYAAEQLAAFFGYELPEVDWSASTSSVSSGLSDIADSADDATSAVKELKNATLGIDELNVISDNSSSGSGGSGSGASVSGGDLGIDLPTYNFLEELTALNSDAIADEIKTHLGIITAVIGGFMIFLGTVLLLAGNIPVGVGLLVSGVLAELSVTALSLNSTEMSNELKDKIGKVIEIVGLIAICVGFILAFTGHIPVGIALIAAGALVLSGGMALRSEALADDVQGAMEHVEDIIAGFVLVIGVALIASGVAMHVGIVLVGIAAADMIKNADVQENWDALSEQTQDALENVAAIVNSFMLMIGVLLAFSGANIAVGITLIAVAIAAEYKALSLDWNTMTEETADSIAAIMLVILAAMLVIGCILAFSGGKIVLGIALMAVGAAGLVAVTCLMWNKLSDEMKTKLNILMAVISAFLLVIGFVLALSGAKIALGIALIAAGAVGLALVIGLNWDTIKNKITEVLDNIKENAGTYAKLALGIILCLSGVGLPIGIALIKQGVEEIQSGETISWDEMKNKITEVLDNIKENAKTAGKLALGVILCCTGVGIPLGLSLIKEAVGEWKTEQTMDAAKLANKVQESFDKVKEKWNTFKNWIKGTPTGELKVDVKNDSTSWWSNVKNWWNNNTRNKTLVATVSTKIKSRTTGAVEYATGGVITPHFAQQIPAYASGTNDIHGSLFVAGEAGAELVGHIGGRSEVLNRFQLASVMHSSIVSGMSLYTAYWKAMSKDVVNCANGVINAITVSGAELNKSFEVNTPKSYEVNGSVTSGVYDISRKTYDSTYDDSYDGMKQFYTEYVEPTLKQMASDTKRQADKEEKTVLQVSGKTLAETIARQQKANGYVFTR